MKKQPKGGTSVPPQPATVPIPLADIQSPPELLVKLVTDPQTGQLRLHCTHPNGRVATLPAEPESMFALVRMLDLLAIPPATRQLANSADALSRLMFAPQSTVDFCPSPQSDWRKASWWPRGPHGPAESCPLTVIAERANAPGRTQPDVVRCRAPNGKAYTFPATQLVPHGTTVKRPQPRSDRSKIHFPPSGLTLADLGF